MVYSNGRIWPWISRARVLTSNVVWSTKFLPAILRAYAKYIDDILSTILRLPATKYRESTSAVHWISELLSRPCSQYDRDGLTPSKTYWYKKYKGSKKLNWTDEAAEAIHFCRVAVSNCQEQYFLEDTADYGIGYIYMVTNVQVRVIRFDSSASPSFEESVMVALINNETIKNLEYIFPPTETASEHPISNNWTIPALMW